MDLKTYLAEKRELVDKALNEFIPESEGPTGELIRAMRYSLFAASQVPRLLGGTDRTYCRWPALSS